MSEGDVAVAVHPRVLTLYRGNDPKRSCFDGDPERILPLVRSHWDEIRPGTRHPGVRIVLRDTGELEPFRTPELKQSPVVERCGAQTVVLFLWSREGLKNEGAETPGDADFYLVGFEALSGIPRKSPEHIDGAYE